MIFFEPSDNFWKYLAGHPWKWKQYHDCGAGAGHLTRLMRERGYSVNAYDMYPRGADDETGGTLRVMDCTSDLFAAQLDTNDVAIIARPCHNNWIAKTARHTFDIGETLYVGLSKNFEMDLDDADLCYEIVAHDVGQEGEKLIRIYCDNAHAKILRLIKKDGGEEWWWYKPALDRYVTAPWSPAGFENGGEPVLKEFKRGNDLQMAFAKDVLCNDKLDVGWIAPDGEFFGCPQCNHDAVMMTVVGISLKRAEALGFIRCHGDTGCGGEMLYVVGRGHMDDDKRRPTPAQAKMLRQKGYKVHR